MLWTGTGIALSINLGIEADDLEFVEIQPILLQIVNWKDSCFGSLRTANHQLLSRQILDRLDTRIGASDEDRTNTHIYVSHDQGLAGALVLDMILGVSQRSIPGDVDFAAFQRCDERI